MPSAPTYLADDHQPGMDTNTDDQPHTFLPLQTRIERSYRLDDAQPGSHAALRIIFVGLRPTKVDQQAIAQILGRIAAQRWTTPTAVS